MHLKETGQEGVGKHPVVEYCEHTNEKPSGFLNAGKFFACWATVSFSRDLYYM
jgi:hypothetical protein